MFALLSLVPLLLASPAFATPLKVASCDISTAVLQLPAHQSQLVVPTSPPSFIVLGVGLQNYTCSPSSTYTSAGAVAELFDISCLAKSPLFATIQDAAYAALPADPAAVTSHEVISQMKELKLSTILGQHYFVTDPIKGTGISPNWDFTQTEGNPNAFVIAAKVASIPAPTGLPDDIDWVSLKSVKGELATQVFRTDTKGGQPPAYCAPGSPPISVTYTSKYWFYA